MVKVNPRPGSNLGGLGFADRHDSGVVSPGSSLISASGMTELEYVNAPQPVNFSIAVRLFCGASRLQGCRPKVPKAAGV